MFESVIAFVGAVVSAAATVNATGPASFEVAVQVW
jgi:hypothetical protein